MSGPAGLPPGSGWRELAAGETAPGSLAFVDAVGRRYVRVEPSILDRPILVTFFTNRSAPTKRTESISLRALGVRIRTTVAPCKEALPWLKGARFGERKTRKGSLRHDGNVIEITAVELDYDGEVMAIDDAASVLCAEEIAGIVYSSPSYTVDAPRWRLVLPLAKPQPPDMRARLVARAAGLFNVSFARESYVLSQSYYFGAAEGRPPAIVLESDGPGFQCIDQRGDRDAGARWPGASGNGADDGFDDAAVFDLDDALAILRDGRNGMHPALVSLAGHYAAIGMRRSDIEAVLRAALHGCPADRRDTRWRQRLDSVPRIVAWVLDQETEKHSALGGNSSGQSDSEEPDPWAEPQPGTEAPADTPTVDSGAPEWPEPVGEPAFHGLIGEIVRAIGPATEADPAAILLQLLTFAGNKIGPGPHYIIENTLHRVNLFTLLIGATAKARKGTSEARVRQFFEIDDWISNCIHTGLSSGEGLIYAVRDAVRQTNKKTGAIETIDEGVTDKRSLIVETEFASTLTVLERAGNTLSDVLRNAWDGRTLRVMTKNAPLRATGAYVSLIGHITEGELRSLLDTVSMANGFGSRFLYGCVRRSNILPHGGEIDPQLLDDLRLRLNDAIAAASTVGRVVMTALAKDEWSRIYSDLSAGRDGMIGALVARSDAYTLRLALLYALLDRRKVGRSSGPRLVAGGPACRPGKRLGRPDKRR
jgi:hypothetical protein